MKTIRAILEWLFAEPEFSVHEAEMHHRILMAEMREDMW